MVEGELITEPVSIIPPSPGRSPVALDIMNLKYINGPDPGVSKVFEAATRLSYLNIGVYDRFGNILNNNGLDWSMTLNVDFIN